MQTTESSPLSARQQLEKDFIIFVIYHTRTLTEAITYLKMKLGALRKRRKTYQITDPPPHHYEGPVLTQAEMVAAFYVSRALAAANPPSLEDYARIKVMLVLPDGRTVTVSNVAHN